MLSYCTNFYLPLLFTQHYFKGLSVLIHGIDLVCFTHCIVCHCLSHSWFFNFCINRCLYILTFIYQTLNFCPAWWVKLECICCFDIYFLTTSEVEHLFTFWSAFVFSSIGIDCLYSSPSFILCYFWYFLILSFWEETFMCSG